MASKKWLLHIVDRSISLKTQEIMHVNYRSGTNLSQFQGTDRWCVRARVIQGEHEWADAASSVPLHLVVHAQQWGTWGNVACSQDIRKVQKRFLTRMNYTAKAVRISKVRPLAIWETSLGSCRGWKVTRGLREVHVLISPERGKKVELGIYPPLICMLILTKNCRMFGSSNGIEGF